MNILITSAGAKVWLVKAFREAMGKGDTLTIQDNSPDIPAKFFTDNYTREIPWYQDKNGKYKISENYDFVCYTRDGELAEESELHHKKSLSSFGARRKCIDKDLFAQHCNNKKFGIPSTLMCNGKIFIKPRIGCGSKMCRTEDFSDFLFQEFIDWPEYTIDVFIHPDGTPISALPRRRVKVINGESWISTTVKNEQLMHESIRLCKSIGLIWHNTVQAFFNGKDIKFIEVNPRFGGGAALGFAAGHHTPKYIVDIIKGKKIKPCIGQFKDGLTMYKYTEEVFV
jgi:carbamoyl-phosphate synthase large subunit